MAPNDSDLLTNGTIHSLSAVKNSFSFVLLLCIVTEFLVMFNKIKINFSAFGNFREMICKPAFARPFPSQKLRCNVN